MHTSTCAWLVRKVHGGGAAVVGFGVLDRLSAMHSCPFGITRRELRYRLRLSPGGEALQSPSGRRSSGVVVSTADARVLARGPRDAELTRVEARWAEVLRDDLGLGNRLAVGATLDHLVDPGSAGKARALVARIAAHQAAFDWELDVPVAADTLCLHFAGGAMGDRILLAGAATSQDVGAMCESLIAINNEQMNGLRDAMKEVVTVSRRAEGSRADHEEMMRLNNELVNLQRELVKKNTDLERVSAEKTQFLGMAAHDLRNPLNVITTYSQFLLEDAAPVLNAEQVEFVTDIRAASEAMLRLITDLLDITAIESGRIELHLVPCDLAALVRRSVSHHALLAAKKDIRVEYSPHGATVRVRLTTDDDGAALSIEDEGAGIPAQELKKLFRPFSRTSVKTTGGEQSTGLGLAIVRKIVAAHSGTVAVDSEVGRGSTFIVRLPRRCSAT